MRTLISTICACMFMLLSSVGIASVTPNKHGPQKKIISDLSYARYFQSSSKGPFYIQTATFKIIDNAHKYKILLSKTIHYPVKIKKQGPYQVVYIGPIKNAAEVRALGEKNLAYNIKNKSKKKAKKSSINKYKVPALIKIHKPIYLSFKLPVIPHFHKNKTQTKGYIPKISIQGGVFTASQGRAQFINLNTLIGDDFSVSPQTSTNGLLGIGLYWNALHKPYADFSYGLNAYYLTNTVTKGLVTRENFDTSLSYKYATTNWPIYFSGKAIFNQSPLQKVSPTLDAGIGLNIIHARGFNEYSLAPTGQPDTIFLNNTQVAFAATAGFGMKFNQFFNQRPLECGYRFFYLGEGSFNRATHQIQSALKTGNSYANALLCSLTI